MNDQDARVTSLADLEAAADEAESRWAIHWDAHRAKHEEFCRACEELEQIAILAEALVRRAREDAAEQGQRIGAA